VPRAQANHRIDPLQRARFRNPQRACLAQAVTLHLIARMRRFARVTAAYLRISSHDIINYAAIMIMPRARVEC